MDKDMALLGFEIGLAAKAIFALGALIAVLMAGRMYWRMQVIQKCCFWLAAVMSVVALVWVASLAFLLTHQTVAHMIPEAGWYFIIFASPTAAIAAGAAMGIYTTQNAVRTLQSS